MGKLIVTFDGGGGGEAIAAASAFSFRVESTGHVFYRWGTRPFIRGQGVQSVVGLIASITTTGISEVIKIASGYNASSNHIFIDVELEGNFNKDSISMALSNFNRRVEVRNEYGVLLADNGLSWADGTYPPDAKNRAGLTGLHAAVINPELETALMGDGSNKERVQE